MKTVPVGKYLNKYDNGHFIIVGKGPTQYDYSKLMEITNPIIFINDAIQFEKWSINSIETFFFAHDYSQRIWISPNLKSTIVIPRQNNNVGNRKPLLDLEDIEGSGIEKVMIYEWGGWYKRAINKHTRDQIAKTGKLYLNSGTIHSAIHFVWLTGASKISYIGCDGRMRQYDRRIDIKSKCKLGKVYRKIRRVQDWMCCELGIKSIYL